MTATMTITTPRGQVRALTDLERDIVERVRRSPGITKGRAGIGPDRWLSSRGRAYRYAVVSRLIRHGVLRDEGHGGRGCLFVAD